MPNGLAVIATLDRIKAELAETTDFSKVLKLKDQAQAIKQYTRQKDIKRTASGYVARSSRRLGEMLKSMERSKGGRPSKTNTTMLLVLSDLDIEPNESMMWQAIAKLPEELFERYLSTAKEITQAGLYNEAKKYNKKKNHRRSTNGKTCTTDDLFKLVDARCQYGTIYADPPWAYGNQSTRAATDNHYDTVSIDWLCDPENMPIEQLAADKAHLHLWTTNAFLFDAKNVMEAWGFEYKSCFVWVKTQMGIGNYWRVSHEFMLLGVRGGLTFADRSLMSWSEYPRTKHSRKPGQVQLKIESASPGPRLELFARSVTDGWTAWGNEITKDLLTGKVELV